MPRQPFTAEQFVRAVYRRLVLIHVAEELGRALFLSAILGIFLDGIALWQSMPTRPVLVFCLIVALLIGAGLSIIRWPARQSAIAAADLQLRMDDLLSTALLPASAMPDDFRNVVTAMADARCALHSPSEVFLRQIGIRRWSGMGLTIAVAITLALFPFNPVDTKASDSNLTALSQNPFASAEQHRPAALQQPPAHDNDPMSEDSNHAFPQADSEMSPDQERNDASKGESSGGPLPGTARGKSSADDRSNRDEFSGSTDTEHHGDKGVIAGGGNGSNTVAAKGDAVAGTASGASANFTPAWDGNKSADSSASSPGNLNSRIPPQDRDLVRKFFSQN